MPLLPGEYRIRENEITRLRSLHGTLERALYLAVKESVGDDEPKIQGEVERLVMRAAVEVESAVPEVAS